MALASLSFTVFILCGCGDPGTCGLGAAQEERLCGPSVEAPKVAPAFSLHPTLLLTAP